MINIAIIALLLLVLSGLLWLFFSHGLDKIRHPAEWKNTGSSGERIVYETLVKKLHIPENQIFRNVYIPINDDKTSEIDIIVVSKKGLFVFECKNYGGNIYGDTKKQKWVQYLGNKKSFFYNPIIQNKNHAKHLKKFFANYNIEVPIVPLIVTISRGKWKVKNLGTTDYILGLNCNFKDIYEKMPNSKISTQSFKLILNKLALLSRPGKVIEEEHIRQINKKAP